MNSQLTLPISRFHEVCKDLRLGGHVVLCDVTKLIGGEEIVLLVWESWGIFFETSDSVWCGCFQTGLFFWLWLGHMEDGVEPLLTPLTL